jgi:hypothetical protein
VSSFYSSLASRAEKLIAKYGQTVTLTRANAGAVDPVTGAASSAASTVLTTKGVIIDYSEGIANGVNILMGDNRVLLSSKVEPKNDDVVTVSNGSYKVISVKILSPAGIVVMYELQVRR